MQNEEASAVPEEDVTLTANVLKAMAHPLRWNILCTLGDQELSVGEIVERVGTSQSNISQHLDSCVIRILWFPDVTPIEFSTAYGTMRYAS